MPVEAIAPIEPAAAAEPVATPETPPTPEEIPANPNEDFNTRIEAEIRMPEGELPRNLIAGNNISYLI